jgi:hypothetical protein
MQEKQHEAGSKQLHPGFLFGFSFTLKMEATRSSV